MGVVLRRGGAWAVNMEQHRGRLAVPRLLFKMGRGSVERVPKGTPPGPARFSGQRSQSLQRHQPHSF